MENLEIKKLSELLDERTMALMARESDLADRMEEIEAQKEELTAAVEELDRRNRILETALKELKERNQELDQILYRASHDLRSPVTSITGVLNILETGRLTDIQTECVGHIRDRANQMNGLLNSLSTLSGTISNNIHYSKVNLQDVIRNCLHDLRDLPNYSSVAVRIESRGFSEVISDKSLVSIVIKNLVSNALVFRQASKPGEVTIRTTASDATVEIEVVDDGEGISEAVKDKIFEMFYRGSERSVGPGLGLYIVKKIVDQLQGHIHVSRGDGLTRFKVVLPQWTP